LDAKEEVGFNKLLKSGVLDQFLLPSDQRSRFDSLEEFAKQSQGRSRESIAGLRRINLNGEMMSDSDLRNSNPDERYSKIKGTDSPNEMRPLFSNSPLKQGKNAFQYIDSPGKLRNTRRSTLDRLKNDPSLFKQHSTPADNTYVDEFGDRYNLYSEAGEMCYVDKAGAKKIVPARMRKVTE